MAEYVPPLRDIRFVLEQLAGLDGLSKLVADLLAQMEALSPGLDAAGPDLAGIGPALADGIGVLREATGWLLSRGPAEPNDALAGATPYLRLSGLVIGGWLMARSALAATRLLPTADGADAAFLQDKIGTARFYAGQLLPQVASLLPAVTAGARPLFQTDLSRATPG
jgi:hypothetical protein